MSLSTDRKIAIVLFAAAVFYLWGAYRLPEFPYTPMDADVIPKGLGYLLALLSVILFVQSKPTSVAAERRRLDKQDIGVLISMFGAMLLYVFLLERVGFLLTTVAFLIFATRFLGYRKWSANVLVSFIFSGAMYYTFNYVLLIYLPRGILPF
ncbi:tripartite tricarboxylate transporter TctB family protein [Numidum massiliense]|uniref:tripartite tricarboxylate transporter TctB family protein n=1 Tax=Numidum massiliense TaxID=1522315 RepID=UPI0006D57EAC|nr:tripartite tricarboxylate transporter TctB family protein [Numidum massiliense]